MIRLASRVWNGYLNALNKTPWRVQIIQTGKFKTQQNSESENMRDQTGFMKCDLEFSNSRQIGFAFFGLQ